MTKPKPLRVKAAEYGQQQLEALGFASKMEFELADGSFVELAHPWLWGDDVAEAYGEAQSTPDLARAALGAEEHARFLKGGGNSNQIVLAVEMMKQREVHDDPKGSKPKRS